MKWACCNGGVRLLSVLCIRNCSSDARPSYLLACQAVLGPVLNEEKNIKTQKHGVCTCAGLFWKSFQFYGILKMVQSVLRATGDGNPNNWKTQIHSWLLVPAHALIWLQAVMTDWLPWAWFFYIPVCKVYIWKSKGCHLLSQWAFFAFLNIEARG